MEYVTYENRDVRCAADVGRMAELGRFDTEFIVYGSATQEENGRIYYHATCEEEKLYDYIQQQALKGKYFTPIACLSLRSKVPAGMKEALLQETKYNLLKQLKKEYEGSDYFSLMQPFFQTKANDTAYHILKAYQEQVDGHFHDRELQLFLGIAQMACKAKVLTVSAYQSFQQWHNDMKRQMSDDPIAEDNLGRTFYGFVYQDLNGSKSCIFDAQKMTVVHQYQEKMLQGILLSPILKKQYWFQQFNQLSAIRKNYRDWLMGGADENYFQLLRAIKNCPSVIDRVALQTAKEAMINNRVASQAVDYYAAQWNVQKIV